MSNREWTERFGTFTQLHTGPGGENPATPPELDESGLPPVKAKAGTSRSKRSAKAAKAAIADALGVKEDSAVLADIDVSGLDAPATSEDNDQ